MKRVLTFRRLGGDAALAVQHAVYGRHLYTPPSSHCGAYLTLVITGGYLERTPHGSRLRSAGTAHFHPPNEINEGAIGSSGAEVLSVLVSGGRWEAMAPWPLDVECPNLPAGRITDLLRAIRASLESSGAGAARRTEEKATELFAEFSAFYASLTNRRPGWLPISERLLLDGVPISQVAEACDIHPASFARSFKRFSGCTPQEFVRRERVMRARVMLNENRISIGEVAAESGFSDQSHLAREIKRELGATPRALRSWSRPLLNSF